MRPCAPGDVPARFRSSGRWRDEALRAAARWALWKRWTRAGLLSRNTAFLDRVTRSPGFCVSVLAFVGGEPATQRWECGSPRLRELPAQPAGPLGATGSSQDSAIGLHGAPPVPQRSFHASPVPCSADERDLYESGRCRAVCGGTGAVRPPGRPAEPSSGTGHSLPAFPRHGRHHPGLRADAAVQGPQSARRSRTRSRPSPLGCLNRAIPRMRVKVGPGGACVVRCSKRASTPRGSDLHKCDS